MSETPVFKVIFYHLEQVYEVYARSIYQSDLYGFIEIEELLFGERTQMIVDPSEERLKNEFTGVKRTYIPMHNVVRIDEVEREGQPKITEGGKSGANVANFPMGGFKPSKD